jgi:hypothetical protein
LLENRLNEGKRTCEDTEDEDEDVGRKKSYWDGCFSPVSDDLRSKRIDASIDKVPPRGSDNKFSADRLAMPSDVSCCLMAGRELLGAMEAVATDGGKCGGGDDTECFESPPPFVSGALCASEASSLRESSRSSSPESSVSLLGGREGRMLVILKEVILRFFNCVALTPRSAAADAEPPAAATATLGNRVWLFPSGCGDGDEGVALADADDISMRSSAGTATALVVALLAHARVDVVQAGRGHVACEPTERCCGLRGLRLLEPGAGRSPHAMTSGRRSSRGREVALVRVVLLCGDRCSQMADLQLLSGAVSPYGTSSAQTSAKAAGMAKRHNGRRGN